MMLLITACKAPGRRHLADLACLDGALEQRTHYGIVLPCQRNIRMSPGSPE